MKKRLAKNVEIAYKEHGDEVYLECNCRNNYFFLTVPKEMVEITLKNIIRRNQ